MIDFLDPKHVVVRDLLERNAIETPNEPFMLFEDGSTWTSLQCLNEAAAAANELLAAGVTRGSAVAVALPNGPDFLRAFWGTAMIGAAMVPVNPTYRGSLISHMLHLSRPVAVVTEGEFRKRLLDAVPNGEFALLDPSELRSTNRIPPALERPIEPWDAVCLAMTSGTTGPSKLVRVAYAQCLQGGTSTFNLWGRSEADVYLMDTPAFHMGAIYIISSSLFSRNKIALRKRPDLVNYWEIVRDTGATMSQIYGTMVNFLEGQPYRAAERQHSLRLALTIPLPADPEEFRKRFGIEHVLSGWGSTEVGCPINKAPGFATTTGSIGRVLPGYQVRLVDENDKEVPVGVPGEAVLRADIPWLISTEYVGNPVATCEVWRNGWFHTGDLLKRDVEGNFYFIDRLKDSLRRRGQNISSYEVEVVVLAFHGVTEAAAVPERTSVEAEDEVKVWVVTENGIDIDFRELLVFCLERLPHHMVPRFFERAAELPKTPSAKIQKHLLRERGNGPDTWDRVANGLEVTRHGLQELKQVS